MSKKHIFAICILGFHDFARLLQDRQISQKIMCNLIVVCCHVNINLHQVYSSQLASSLLTTCSRLDIIKPEQVMRTHPDIALMIASCNKPAADLLQLVRFWLCIPIRVASSSNITDNLTILLFYFLHIGVVCWQCVPQEGCCFQ